MLSRLLGSVRFVGMEALPARPLPPPSSVRRRDESRELRCRTSPAHAQPSLLLATASPSGAGWLSLFEL